MTLQPTLPLSQYALPLANFTIAVDHMSCLRIWPCALSFLTWTCIPGLTPLKT